MALVVQSDGSTPVMIFPMIRNRSELSWLEESVIEQWNDKRHGQLEALVSSQYSVWTYHWTTRINKPIIKGNIDPASAIAAVQGI